MEQPRPSDAEALAGEDGSGSEFAHLFVFANEKAGMTQVDKAKVNQVIYDMSKDSSFFKNAQRQDAKTQARVKAMKEKLGLARPAVLEAHRVRADNKAEDLDASLRLDRIFVVVDMDMFFAAVEMRDDPSLIGKPVAVGGIGMISTANYEARRYGVRSAMPGFIAKKLCPELVFVGGSGSFAKYRAASEEVRRVLRQYDPNLSGSIDEAYMDLTPFVDREFGTDRTTEERMQFAFAAVQEMRRRVSNKTRLTCSAGIAATKMIAKIASDMNKPNGQHMVPATKSAMRAFVHELPIRKVPGIGKVTEKLLSDSLNVQNVGDLWRNRALCSFLFKPRSADWFLRVCLCCTEDRESSAVPFESNPRSRKSISLERTFRDKGNIAELSDMCQDLCRKLAQDCVKKGIRGRCFTLKLKTNDFHVRQRQITFSTALPCEPSGDELFRLAHPLLVKELPCTLRLMGVRLSHLDDGASSAAHDAPPDKETRSPSRPREWQARIESLFAQQSSRDQSQRTIRAREQSGAGSSGSTGGSDEPCVDSTPPACTAGPSASAPRGRGSKSPRGDFPGPGQRGPRSAVDGAGAAQSGDPCMVCPVCNAKLPGASNAELNAHVDECLNASVIESVAYSSGRGGSESSRIQSGAPGTIDEGQSAPPVIESAARQSGRARNDPSRTQPAASGTINSFFVGRDQTVKRQRRL